jgi:2-C-methyl-D-erythritol 4-phosphate cytidylyltransferase
MKKYVLIASGGIGKRMGSATPKQFLEIAGKPVLMHAFLAFLSYAPDMEFVLVMPESHIEDWQKLCSKNHFEIHHHLVPSGPTRFHTVKNGLRLIPDDSLVAIHDAARPLVSLNTIARVFHFAAKFGNAIPVLKPNDSMRMVEGPISKPLDREKLRMVQTPQCFHGALIKKAYNKNYHESFTDDSTVLEADGVRLFLVDGNVENIKITTPSDLLVAKALMKKKDKL